MKFPHHIKHPDIRDFVAVVPPAGETSRERIERLFKFDDAIVGYGHAVYETVVQQAQEQIEITRRAAAEVTASHMRRIAELEIQNNYLASTAPGRSASIAAIRPPV